MYLTFICTSFIHANLHRFWCVYARISHTKLDIPIQLLKFLNFLSHRSMPWKSLWLQTFSIVKLKYNLSQIFQRYSIIICLCRNLHSTILAIIKFMFCFFSQSNKNIFHFQTKNTMITVGKSDFFYWKY